MAKLEPLLTRREAREPLAFILGRREFWSLDFEVSPATLIPRPESETLIEAAVAAFANRAPPRLVLDLGTGTGCLLLAALSEFATAFGIGVDRSAAASELAARNAQSLGMADRAAFFCGDWADALGASFDLVLCNPPYIPTSELDGLMPEVAHYEPATALNGGDDGLAAYRRIIADLPRLLAPKGIAAMEFGAGQAGAVGEIAQLAGLTHHFRDDLGGTARVLLLQRPLP